MLKESNQNLSKLWDFSGVHWCDKAKTAQFFAWGDASISGYRNEDDQSVPVIFCSVNLPEMNLYSSLEYLQSACCSNLSVLGRRGLDAKWVYGAMEVTAPASFYIDMLILIIY